MNKTILFAAVACLAASQTASAQRTGAPGPHVLVYKTRADYHKLVPVVLSDDKSRIVSYPDPHDIKVAGKKLLPTTLHKGYLLDNRGISTNTAFINMTWEKYAALPAAPAATELYAMISDKDPITELCDCGSKNAGKGTAAEINKLIDGKKLHKNCALIRSRK